MKNIRIEDKEFFCVGPEIDPKHEEWLLAILRGTAVTEICREEGESDDSYRDRIFARLEQRTDVFTLTAGIMLPSDVVTGAWLNQIVEESASFFRGLSSPESGAAFKTMTVAGVINFAMTFRKRPNLPLLEKQTAVDTPSRMPLCRGVRIQARNGRKGFYR